jgi:pyrroline-5-carboxylate reductase
MSFWLIYFKITNKTIGFCSSGLSIKKLQSKIGDKNQAMRIMPNIAAQFGESATCISFTKIINRKQEAVALFQDLGTAPVIDEKINGCATVLAASGTAFALRYIDQCRRVSNRFDWKTALAISAQTVKGAAEMLMENKCIQNN